MRESTSKKFNWPERKIDFSDLLLDPENERLVNIDPQELRDQKNIIKNLVEQQKVLNIAKKISTQGFVPVEKIIVLKKGKRYVVLEGNRRIAAIKCMINPELAGEQKSAFEKLGTNIEMSDFKKIPAFVAPSRKEAFAKYIIPKHTENATIPWPPFGKSRMFANMVLKDKLEISEISEDYNVKESDIVDAVKMHEAYQVARGVILDDEIKRLVEDEKKFPISTLERLIEKKKVLDFLGIDFTEKGELKVWAEKTDFIKRYSKIISDLAEKRIDSRTLSKIEDIERYLKTIRLKTKLPKKKGKPFSSSHFRAIKISKRSPKGKSPRKETGANSIAVYNFDVGLESQIIKNLHNEMKLIKFNKNPYTLAVTFRAFLHMCCWQYCRDFNIDDDSLNWKKGEPKLNQFLSFFNRNNVFDSHIKKSITKFTKQSQSDLNLHMLNEINHGNTHTVTEGMIKKMFEELEQFLIKLLEGKSNDS